MSAKIDYKNRFAIIENIKFQKIVSFLFETEYNITGPNIAVVGLCDAENITQIYTNYPLQIVFDSESSLNFDEAIKSRKKSQAKITIGTYTFEGFLTKSRDCDFIFQSDLLKGKWRICPEDGKRGILSSFFSGDLRLAITRLEAD
jgi:hypothetical protein